STRVELDGEQLNRLAIGHNGDRELASSWEFGALAGAGALYSTSRDLLALLRVHIDPRRSSLRPAIELARATRQALAPMDGAIGLGWHIRPDGTHWHRGQTGGYYSFIAYHREQKLAVVLLANTATWIGDDLAERLLGAARGEWRRLDLPQTAEVAPAALARYAGVYRPFLGKPLTLTVRDGQLVGRTRALGSFRLYPLSDSEFYLRVLRARVVFTSAGERVTGLDYSAGGRQLRAEREP
ncbi:MAG: serine hydrolase domain-containing protein, partial [Myxococcota bacterium]